MSSPFREPSKAQRTKQIGDKHRRYGRPSNTHQQLSDSETKSRSHDSTEENRNCYLEWSSHGGWEGTSLPAAQRLSCILLYVGGPLSEKNDNVGLGGLFDLSFEKFITPSVVKIVYILVIVLAGLMWLFAAIAGISNGIVGFLVGVIVGGFAFLIIILIYRIFLELTMILFRIHDNTETLANKP